MLGAVLTCPALAEQAAPVKIALAAMTPVVREIPLTGTVTARDHAALSSRVSGLVSAVHVTTGDRVDKGTLLLSLDPTLEKLALLEAKATTAEARAVLKEAQRVWDEARRLGPEKGVPISGIRAAEAEVKIAETRLQRLRVAERYRQEMIARHDLYAPFAGVVVKRLAEEGEWVDTGTPVMEVVGTGNLRLDLRVPQEHYPYINGDTRVTVTLDALPALPVDTRIEAKVPLSDASSRTFLLRIRLPEQELDATPGMSARARLRIPGSGQALTVPRDAILRDAYGASRVWVLTELDGATIATQHSVETGRTFDGHTEVRGGLESGARVVIRGNEALREGQPVTVVP